MQHVIVYALAAGCLFFLALITLATPRKVNVKANSWLGFFLFAFACNILDRVLFEVRWYEQYPEMQGVLEVTRFAMAPALYLSVLCFTFPGRNFKATDYWHFVPFFLFFLFIVSVFLHVNDGPLFAWYQDLPDTIRQGVAITIFSSLKVQIVIYWILSWVQLVRHQRNIRLFASTLDPISLKWLQYFLLGIVVVIFLSLNESLVIIPAIIPVTHFGYLLLTFYIGYYSIHQQEIFPYLQKDVADLRGIIETERQTKSKRIAPDLLAASQQRLLQLMVQEKVYLDPDLGLPGLASRLQMSSHDLSYVINEGFQENFFQFINRYRIEEAKILLRSSKYKHLSILGIAFECGFRSKTTFNTSFKKITGQSPSQFMQDGPGLEAKAV